MRTHLRELSKRSCSKVAATVPAVKVAVGNYLKVEIYQSVLPSRSIEILSHNGSARINIVPVTIIKKR